EEALAMSNVVSTPTGGYDAKQIEDAKLLASLGYLPLLLCGLPTFLIPLLVAKQNRFAQFHARQAALLYLVGVGGVIAAWIVSAVFSCVGSLALAAVAAGMFVLGVIGVVNVFQGQAKELPFLGPYAGKLPF